VDWLSPFHLLILAVVVAAIMGPERAGRTAARIVQWVRTYRRMQSSLTPTGIAQHLWDAVAATPPAGPPGPVRAAPPSDDAKR
jgi:hypothetical protein